MVSYVQNLQKYLDCARSVSDERWEYPTKEELAARNKSLQSVRTYALGKTKSKLRSQHALLYMRCNMLLAKHQENVTFWEETASQYIETVYKDMMKNIYAGALQEALLCRHPPGVPQQPECEGVALPVAGLREQRPGG